MIVLFLASWLYWSLLHGYLAPLSCSTDILPPVKWLSYTMLHMVDLPHASWLPCPLLRGCIIPCSMVVLSLGPLLYCALLHCSIVPCSMVVLSLTPWLYYPQFYGCIASYCTVVLPLVFISPLSYCPTVSSFSATL